MVAVQMASEKWSTSAEQKWSTPRMYPCPWNTNPLAECRGFKVQGIQPGDWWVAFEKLAGFPVFQALAKAVTIAVHLQNMAVVGEAVHQSSGHCGILKYRLPLFKGEIGGDN